MNNDHDPVDSALNLLRSNSWTAQSNPQLEEKLMQEFSNQQNRPRLTARPALMVALGVLLIGGGAFAATGGIAKLKSWVFRVNINGHEATLVANDGEPASMTIQGEDGKTTHIAVMSASADGGHRTEVNVNANDPNGKQEQQQQIRVIRHNGNGPAPEVDDGQKYTMADLGDTQPSQSWTDKNGNTLAIYVVQTPESTIKVFHVTTDANGQSTVKLLVAPAMKIDISSVKPQVTVDDNGMTTMTFDDGKGEKRVMKLKIAHQDEESAEMPNDGSINIKTEDGHIQVEVNKNDDQD
jgi:hypothetical protein